MSVHYKFKSALEYDTVTFDGLHISLRDLKKSILHQKRIGKNTDFDLQVTNAQSKEVYTDDGCLIPKNTSLIISRIPLTAQQKKAWDRAESNQQLAGVKTDALLDGQDPSLHRLSKAVDLSSLDASEEDKILAMMSQSTQDYSPSNYIKVRGANQVGEVPPNYRCYKCHQPGHWIKNCTLGSNQDPIDIKKSTGIPRSFMVPVEGPLVPGAMMTPGGTFAVPAVDHQAYKEGKKERPPFQPEPEHHEVKPDIPEDLLCSVCRDLLTDAVMIPCCGNSFCDECVRTVLLESEDHECPDCKERDVSPDTLIPNRFLRNAVNNFRNETGYNKTRVRQAVAPPPHPVAAVAQVPEVPAHVADSSLSVGHSNPEQSLDQPLVLQTLQISRRRSRTYEGSGLPPNDGIHRADRLVHSTLPHPPPPGVVPSEASVMIRQHHHVYSGSPVGPPGVIPPPGSMGSMPPHPPGPNHHMQPMHQGYPPQQSLVRRSLEERPGTPTIDERTLDAVLPDTSVPPPNLPSVTIEAQFRPQRPPMYRPHVPVPQPYVAAPVSLQQPIRGFVPLGPQFEPRMPFHHDPNVQQVSRPPHYPELDSARGVYRGSYRPRTRGYPAGAYRGVPLPTMGRQAHHNGTQASGIADTLAVFEKMIREKDDRDRKRRARRSRSRSLKRSYSRSRSRSRSRTRSYSRSPPRKRDRDRSRSPRSRSFTISRSRSRSYSRSPLPRERLPPPRERTPLPRERERDRSPLREREREYSPRREKERDYSPRRDKEREREYSPRAEKEYSPRRRPEHPMRFRSPARSPTRFTALRDRGFKDAGFKDRDFKESRDYKDNRDYKETRDYKEGRDYPDFYPEPEFGTPFDRDRGGGRRPFGPRLETSRKEKEYFNPPSSGPARYRPALIIISRLRATNVGVRQTYLLSWRLTVVVSALFWVSNVMPFIRFITVL